MKFSSTWTTVTPLSKTLALVVFILFPFIGFYLGIQYHKSTYVPPSLVNISQPPKMIVSPTLGVPMDYEVVDGNIYALTADRHLYLDKTVDSNHPNDTSGYFKYINADLSPDKTQLLVIAQGGITVPYLYFTPVNKLNLKFISTAEQVVWSPDSQRIAYISRPADAGPSSILAVYDTKLDKTISLTRPVIGVAYDDIGYNSVKWTSDSKSLIVGYAASKHTTNDDNPSMGTTVKTSSITMSVPMTFMDIKPETNFTTSAWKTYTNPDYHLSISYPLDWSIEKEVGNDQDSYIPGFILGTTAPNTKFNGVRIHFGDPEVFSTAGNLYCEARYCNPTGKITLPIKGKTFTTDIIEAIDEGKNGQRTISYYAFQFTADSFTINTHGFTNPTHPVITVYFYTPKQGQEIANILSTIKQL